MATQDRLPTSNGFSSQMLSFNGVNNWEECDDPVGSPDGDATYVYRDGSLARNQYFGFTAFDIDSDSIAKIIVTVCARYEGGAAPNVAGFLRIGGTQYLATAQVIDSSYTDYVFEWTLDPSTSSAWIEADVEAIAEFGFRRTGGDGSTQTRVTQCYVTVEYTEGGGAPPANDGMMQFFQGL